MSDDELSISFASSMGIKDIKDECLNNSNFYSDLDELEKSVDAEFDEYIRKSRNFTFKSQATSSKSIEQMKQNINNWQQYLNNKSDNRPTSPGEYFGARSLPLDSLPSVWQQRSHDSDHRKDAEKSSIYENESLVEENEVVEEEQNQSIMSTDKSIDEKPKTEIQKLLNARFKSLPKSIRVFADNHTNYTQSQNSDNILKQAQKTPSITSHGVRSFTNSSIHSANTPSYIIEPLSPLHFLCELSSVAIYAKIIHIKITNLDPDIPRDFSLLSRNDLLEFELQEGTLHDVVEVGVKIKSSVLLPYQRRQLEDEPCPLNDAILVLIDDKEVNWLTVNIDFIKLEEEEEDQKEDEFEEVVNEEYSPIDNRPKCRFCALEKGYPLHCLS